VTGVGYDSTNGQCHLSNGERVFSHSHPPITRVVEIGCVCNNAQLAHDTVIGQPTEGALLVLAMKVGAHNFGQIYL
jgi:Ca2+-transporting ATPase